MTHDANGNAASAADQIDGPSLPWQLLLFLGNAYHALPNIPAVNHLWVWAGGLLFIGISLPHLKILWKQLARNNARKWGAIGAQLGQGGKKMGQIWGTEDRLNPP